MSAGLIYSKARLKVGAKVLELVAQIVLEALVVSPGAFVLWAMKGFKGSYKSILVEQKNFSIFIGVAFWVLVAAIGTLIARSVG